MPTDPTPAMPSVNSAGGLRRSLNRSTWLACVTIAAAVGTTGCVNTRNVTLGSDVGSRLSGKSIVLASRERPGFALNTSSRIAVGAMFGALGGAIAGATAIKAGNELVTDNQIEDPAPALGATLLSELVATYHLNVAAGGSTTIDSEQPEQIARAYPGADLVLDVGTTNWSVIYFPTDWSHYGVMYAVKLNLVETRTGQNIAAAFCIRKPDKTADPPSINDLTFNQAARLKTMLAAAAQSCLAELRSGLHGV